MNDAPGVGGGQAGGELLDDIDDRLEPQPTLARKPIRQALAPEVLHHQVGGPVGSRIVINHLDDVGVLQCRRDARFPVEPRQCLWVFRQRRRQNLDCVATLQPGMGRFVDQAHAPLGDQAIKVIRAI